MGRFADRVFGNSFSLFRKPVKSVLQFQEVMMQPKRRFIRSVFVLVVLLLSTSVSSAKSCLWKVSSGEGLLYLQGSVHVLKAENFPLAPALEEAYSESTELFLEVDAAAMASPRTQQMIMTKAMLPSGRTLKDELNADVYALTEKAFADAGMPIVAVQQFKPWFAAMTLTMVRMQGMGFDPNLGLDNYFHAKAIADGKKTSGLETVDFQINLLDSLAEGNPNEFMAKSLEDLETIDEKVDELMTAWQGGDIHTVGKLINKSFKGYPALYEKFIVVRNKDWAEQLETLLADSTPRMIVVGAGHLPGKDGLLALLKAKGFKIEQL
jgi:uncharacterized protein YbaP (TraB family)